MMALNRLPKIRITRLEVMAVMVALVVRLALAPRIQVQVVNAAPAAPYALDWYTMDGGGGLSSAGDYTLHGTIGQPDAGLTSGGDYALQGGFWGLQFTVAGTVYTVYLPVVLQCNGFPVCTN